MAYELKSSDGSPVKVNGEQVFVADYSVKSVDVAGRRMRIIGTDETQDRDGDIIRVKGWILDPYKANPVFLWAHNYRSVPLARAEKVIKRKDPPRMEFQLRFPSQSLYPFADMILALYGEAIVNASSVGFIPKKRERLPDELQDPNSWKPGYEFLSQELLELSGCPVPSNPSALVPRALEIVGDKKFGGIPGSEMMRWIQEEKFPEPDAIDDILEEIECTRLEFEEVPGQRLLRRRKEDEEDETYDLKPDHSVDYSGKDEEEEIEEIVADVAKEFDIELDGELKDEEEKPYPNEHACRLKPPNYPKYARKNCFRRVGGKCVDYIFGIRGPKKSDLQALRFKKATWTAAAARKVCSRAGGSFEAAKSLEEITDKQPIKLEEGVAYLIQLDTNDAQKMLEKLADLEEIASSTGAKLFVFPKDAEVASLDVREMLEKLKDVTTNIEKLISGVSKVAVEVSTETETKEATDQAEADDRSGHSEGEGEEDVASTILSEAFEESDNSRSQAPVASSLGDKLKTKEGQELLGEFRKLSKLLQEVAKQ
jgi:hypothetical protein